MSSIVEPSPKIPLLCGLPVFGRRRRGSAGDAIEVRDLRFESSMEPRRTTRLPRCIFESCVRLEGAAALRSNETREIDKGVSLMLGLAGRSASDQEK